MTAILDVLLFLLKCIGILLLVILGLVLVLVVSVLLVPIRYKGRLDKKEAPEELFAANGLVSWLNPIVRVRIRYIDNKLQYTVRLFGICLKDSNKPKKEKKKKKKVKGKEKKNHKKKEKKKHTPEVVSSKAEEPEHVSATRERSFVSETPEERPTDVSANVQSSEQVSESDGQEEKKSLFTKIKGIYEKIRGIPSLIKQKVKKIVDTVKLLWYKKEKTIAFLQDELHRTALGTSWVVLKQVLRHILPGKIKGQIEFGTGEPESTGKALAALGILYAWYGKGITVVPDFYEKRIVAEIKFKGRIRCGTLLIKGLRLIRDKQVKRLISNFKKLLTILKQKAE